MSKLANTKKVVKIVVGVSTSFAVSQALRQNVGTSGPIGKTMVWVAGIAVGGVVSVAAENYIDEQIDILVKSWNEKDAIKIHTL